MSRKRFFLVDGMSHIYRAYYAIRGLGNSRGMPTNAVYGFTSMLRKLVEEQKPDYLGVAFDLEGPTVRHERYGEYKATRKPMPEDLVQQIPYIRRVCEAFHVPVIGCPGYEADDVIGTLTRQAAARDLESVIVTSDKDMLQLVSDRVVVFDAMKDRFLGAPEVEEKLGVRPDQVPDLLGLWGDASDNVPGAPGIGEKGARELIRDFGSIENLLKNRDQVRKKSHQASLRDYEEQILMSRELATIRLDLPIELDLEALALRPPDRKAAFELFSELEFKALMEEFLDEEVRKPLTGGYLSPSDTSSCAESMRRHGILFVELGVGGGTEATASAVALQGGADDAVILDLANPDQAALWRELAEDPARRLVCWDSKLFLVLQERAGVRPGQRPIDVMLMAFLTAPNAGDYSLKRWALDRLHLALEEEKGPRQGSLLPEEPGVRAEILCRRLDAVRRLHEALDPELDRLGLRRLYEEIDLPLVPVLAEMERTGIRVDRDRLKKMSAEMEQRLAGLTAGIYEAAGVEFNINSPKQLGEVLFEKLNLPSLKKTRKTGGYSTDQGVLEDLAETYEIPRLILEYRQVAKLKSTYVDAIPVLINPRTGRVHTSFNQTGTATGRLSSSDPNLQNIPIRTEMGRLIRGAFVPEPGNLLISADYSQVELRVLAHLSGDEVLVSAFRAGEDIHDRTAREVFSAEQLENRAECRRRAKAINFGIVYGQSAFGLAKGLGISREEAQAFIDAYFRRYSGVRAWLDRTVEEAREQGMVRTIYGRIRPVPEMKSKDFNVRSFGERIAVNSPIQGTAADIVKIAMVRVHRSLAACGARTRILLQVHDELVLEAPRGEAEEAGRLVREEMEGAAELVVPLKVDLRMADNWMDTK
ncbi:MAG: DNA polymerase I [Acidobacteriota bacterium]|jgi:DNA polymerase-1|nr:DNA polymerase I [Acidobacteriota bacterium]NLT32520.1 DNA polymerase I [Acidobacteriota bacterium]